jgi:cell division protein FtsW
MSSSAERVRTLKVVLPLVLLLGIGLVMVYDASIVESQTLFGDRYHFVRLHAVSIVIGLIIAAAMSKAPTPWLQRLSPFTFGLSILLLVAVLLPGLGITAQGAQRWLSIGPLKFQPSEITKLTTVLYLSTWLTSKRKFGHFLLLMGLLLFLLALQPDLGTAIILVSTGFFMLFVSKVPIKSFALAAVGVAGVIGVLILVAPYRLQRLTTFLNPTADPLGSGYHINQILISLGSGGLFGLGLGRSRQKFQYLPEVSTDSIFAVVGEELGFVGASFLLLLFLALFYQLFRISLRETDVKRKLLASGLSGWLVIQTIVNLAGMVALLPLTGIPLPFISYGRSSLLTQLASIGIIMRISLTQK